jgi:hypothetical protein
MTYSCVLAVPGVVPAVAVAPGLVGAARLDAKLIVVSVQLVAPSLRSSRGA